MRKSEFVVLGFSAGITLSAIFAMSYIGDTKRAEIADNPTEKVRDFISTPAPQPRIENVDYGDVVPDVEPLYIDENKPDIELDKLREKMHLNMGKIRISNKQKTDIIQEIILQSETYNVDPKLVYAILFTESAFKNKVKHQPTYVKQLKTKVQAIGMGGVVWEFWGDYLLENTSLTQKSDLKKWRKNIEATAAILAYLSNYRKHPKAKDVNESAAIRYYGLYDKDYVQKTSYHLSNF